MPIVPLPQFEADLEEHLKEQADREAYERLNAPSTIVVRFGVLQRVGEFPYSGDAKPGCGSKLVVRTERGVELGEMLTSTCPNAGCSKSVSRREMLEYIENSGGRQYPFFDGTKRRGGHRDEKPRVLRIATAEDQARQQAIEQSRHGLKMDARREAESLRVDIKIVDAEPILGGEVLTFYYASEERREVGTLQHKLADLHGVSVELHQVGARDEARITADNERCGQHCCCKSFLKVLKPVSMRSAKVQKATLDPLKISGRCGRLMCCLRYEDETYSELKKRLPHRKSRVGTPEGDGIVVDTQILTQLALVRLESDGRRVAIPVEELTEPGPERAPEDTPRPTARGKRPREDKRPASKGGQARKASVDSAEAPAGAENAGVGGEVGGEVGEAEPKPKKKRRRRRKRRTDEATATGGAGEAGASENNQGESAAGPGEPGDSEGGKPRDMAAPGPDGKPRKRRRRRKRSSDGDGGSDSGSGGGGSGTGGSDEGGEG